MLACINSTARCGCHSSLCIHQWLRLQHLCEAATRLLWQGPILWESELHVIYICSLRALILRDSLLVDAFHQVHSAMVWLQS